MTAAHVSRYLLALQALACAGAALLIVLPRPSAPAVLLVPLTAHARTALPALALDGRNRLVGVGALPGTLIVNGAPQSAVQWIRRGVLAIAVPLRGCTAGAAR